jgi:ABC-2 type transport system permease protein
VFRAVLMAGAYPALIAVIGLGIGAVVRHTAGALCVLVGVLFVLPLLFAPLSASVENASQNFLPHPMANALTADKPLAHTLPPGVVFGLLCAYAIGALAAGAWALTGRDA